MNQKTIAKALDISRGTVSLALSGSPLINKKTRQRVIETAKRLGYHPNLAARSIVTGRTMSVGIMLPSIAHPFNAALVDGLQQHLLASGYVGLYCPSNGPEDYRQALETLLPRRVDGVIAVATDPELIALLRRQSVPAAYYAADRKGVDEVTMDSARGGWLAATHLTDLGHTRIAFVGPTNRAAGRFQGFADALKASGCPLRREYSRHLVPGFGPASAQQGREVMAALLQLRARPTAVFAHNDLLAFGALRVVQEAGLSVPGDVSIIGHDDTSGVGFLPVPLTSIHLPVERIARELVQLMLTRIGRPRGKRVRVVLEPTLAVRESTARCRVDSGGTPRRRKTKR
jgi:LacI family transcriptional regulator